MIPGVTIPQAIALLRKELATAIEEGKHEALKFEVLEVEVDLQVALVEERATEVKGDLKAKVTAKKEVTWIPWVLKADVGLEGELGAGASRKWTEQSASTHTMRLKLKPELPGKRPAHVASDQADAQVVQSLDD